jgi:hypothetical protein
MDGGTRFCCTPCTAVPWTRFSGGISTPAPVDKSTFVSSELASAFARKLVGAPYRIAGVCWQALECWQAFKVQVATALAQAQHISTGQVTLYSYTATWHVPSQDHRALCSPVGRLPAERTLHPALTSNQ